MLYLSVLLGEAHLIHLNSLLQQQRLHWDYSQGPVPGKKSNEASLHTSRSVRYTLNVWAHNTQHTIFNKLFYS
jgi:hypothetical protein